MPSAIPSGFRRATITFDARDRAAIIDWLRRLEVHVHDATDAGLVMTQGPFMEGRHGTMRVLVTQAELPSLERWLDRWNTFARSQDGVEAPVRVSLD